MTSLINKLILQAELQALYNILTSLGHSIAEYNLMIRPKTATAKASKLTSIVTSLQNQEANFTTSDNSGATLPYQLQFSTMYIAMLAEQAYNSSKDDPVGAYKATLESTINYLTKAALDSVSNAIAWRVGQISVSESTLTDTYNGYSAKYDNPTDAQTEMTTYSENVKLNYTFQLTAAKIGRAHV